MGITRNFLEDILQEQMHFEHVRSDFKLIQRPVTVSDDPDYNVTFEMIMEPDSPDKMRAEFWLTDEGDVSIGLESYQRLATRMNLKPVRQGFAAGHEPLSISERGLRSLLAVVANGSIGIDFTQGLGYIWSTRAVASVDVIQTLKEGNYHHLSWIRQKGQRPKLMVERKIFSGAAQYIPWSSR